jgi:outer membrane protein
MQKRRGSARKKAYLGKDSTIERSLIFIFSEELEHQQTNEMLDPTKMLVRLLKKSPLIALMLVFSTTVLCANDLNDSNRSRSSLKGAVGIGTMIRTKYEGSNKYTYQALPVLDISYKSFFVSPFRGAGINVLLSKELVIAPAIGIRPKRPRWEIEERGAMKGFNDLGATAGISTIYRIEKITISARAFMGLSSDNGTIMGISAGYMETIGEQWALNFSVSTEYADKKYNQTFFGITPKQSGKYHFDIYEAKSGFKDIGLNVNISHNITKMLSISAIGGYKRFIDIAADSPIVESGTPDQYHIGVAISHRF